MVDIEHLRSFLAIVETGSFTRAAERVGRTQSALSVQMSRLEVGLGVTLFVKQGRGVRVSPDGARLIWHARRVLEAEADLVGDLSATGLAGRVVLGIPDDYAAAFLPQIVERLAVRHPRLEMTVQCYSTGEIGARLRDGEVDVALVTDEAGVSGVEILRREPLRWVVGLHAGPIEYERPLPIALPAPNCMGRSQAMGALSRAGVTSRLVLSSSSYAAIKPIVQAGRAVTVLPDGLIERATQRVASADANLPELPPVQYGLARRPIEPVGTIQTLIEAVRDCVRETVR